MKSIRRFVYAAVLVLSVLNFAPSVASAQDAVGTFTLTHEVRWQNWRFPVYISYWLNGCYSYRRSAPKLPFSTSDAVLARYPGLWPPMPKPLPESMSPQPPCGVLLHCRGTTSISPFDKAMSAPSIQPDGYSTSSSSPMSFTTRWRRVTSLPWRRSLAKLQPIWNRMASCCSPTTIFLDLMRLRAALAQFTMPFVRPPD